MLHFFWNGYVMREQSLAMYEYSNLEIAKWAEHYLSQYTSFNQTSWHRGKVTESPNDILLGHLTWDSLSIEEQQTFGRLVHDWVKENALSPGAAAHPNTYILTPWVPHWPDNWTDHMPFMKTQLHAASKIFALCGKIWIERTLASTESTPQVQVKDKLVHCNMGLAAHNFRWHKTKFNEIGERQILHISNLAPYKGFELTCQSVDGLETMLHVATKSLPDRKIGLMEFHVDGQAYVFNYIGIINNHYSVFEEWVINDCDFYIHTAYEDAQATTILENCARGLIPLVTPESGFASPHAI